MRGTITPGARGAVVAVQRERRGRWLTIAVTRLRSGGGYGAMVPQVGTYRVRYRGLAGPAVRVR